MAGEALGPLASTGSSLPRPGPLRVLAAALPSGRRPWVTQCQEPFPSSSRVPAKPVPEESSSRRRGCRDQRCRHVGNSCAGSLRPTCWGPALPPFRPAAQQTGGHGTGGQRCLFLERISEVVPRSLLCKVRAQVTLRVVYSQSQSCG